MPEVFSFTSAHLLVAFGAFLLALLVSASIYLRAKQHLLNRYRDSEDHKDSGLVAKLFQRKKQERYLADESTHSMIIRDPEPRVQYSNSDQEVGVLTHTTVNEHASESIEENGADVERAYAWANSELDSDSSVQTQDEQETDSYTTYDEPVEDNNPHESESVDESQLVDPVLRKPAVEAQDDHTFFVGSFSSDFVDSEQSEVESETDDSSNSYSDSYSSMEQEESEDYATQVESNDAIEENTFDGEDAVEDQSIHDENQQGSSSVNESQSDEEELHSVSLFLLFEKDERYFKSNPQPFIQCLREMGFVQIQDEFVLHETDESNYSVAIHARNYEERSLAELADFPVNTVGFRLYFRVDKVANPITALDSLSSIAFRIEEIFLDEHYSYMPLRRHGEGADGIPVPLSRPSLQRIEDELRLRYPKSGRRSEEVHLESEPPEIEQERFVASI